MARIKYREINFRADRLKRIVQINSILTEYAGAVSVRQLYYRLVAAALIPNQQSEYDKVQGLITDARYAGLIDWDDIEDRNREATKAQDWEGGRAALDEVVEKFRMDRWETQPYYVELWVEKAALAGVLEPISADYHITLMVNRGYSSASAMKDSAERIKYRTAGGRRAVVLYIGDFDPSGQHMVTDIRARLAEFGCPSSLDVRKVALTWEQIQQYEPPPNPVKMTDSRAAEYVALYNTEESWEADALPPKTLDLIVRQTINSYVDKEAMLKAITRENLVKAQIKKFALGFKEALDA